MNRYFTTITNTRGDSLPGFKARVLSSTGEIVNLSSDNSGTAIADDLAIADDEGVVEFFWTAADGQTLQFLDAADNLVRAIPNFANNQNLANMYGELATTAIDGLDTALGQKALASAVGITGSATNLGTFTSPLIDDNATVKAALESVGTNLAASGGSALVGFINTGTGASATTLQARGRKTVLVSDFSTLAQALASGAGKVEVDIDVTITADVTLASDQVLEFTQGSLVVDAGATITDAVLKSSGGSNITIINPRIDASATASGVPGIKLVDVTGANVTGGKLTKCNLRYESGTTTTVRGIVSSGQTIDMDGYASTAVYLSGVNGVQLHAINCYGGLEGVGIYNGANNITHSQILSHDHTGDAFVIINGQKIAYTDCFGFSVGQSGFTTQRQTSGANVREVSWTNCYAWDTDFDGFDIRGATTTPWGVGTAFLLTNCHAWDNLFVGFYIVNAEDTSLTNCEARQNGLQGFNIDTSDNVLLSNCRSISNAVDATSGTSKAGIIVASSLNVQVNNCKSSNTEGSTQDYGIVFGGTCTGSTITGGDFLNNTTLSHSLVTGVAMSTAQFNREASGAVTLLEISPNGTKRGESVGIPKTSFTLNWPNGSKCTRTDGGGPEDYITWGSNNWARFDVTVI